METVNKSVECSADENMKMSAPLTWHIISENRDKIMGIAILWVMALHVRKMGTTFPEQFAALDFVMSKGGIGVDVFLFLSGISIYYSLAGKKSLKTFYLKRVQRVVIPYLMMATPFWFYQCAIRKHDVVAFLSELTIASFWTRGHILFWYVSMILLLYAVSPLLYRLLREEETCRKRNLLLILAGVLLFLYLIRFTVPEYFETTEIALTRIPVYIVGFYMAPVIRNKKQITAGDLFVICSILLLNLFIEKYSIRGMWLRLYNGVLAISLSVMLSGLFLWQEKYRWGRAVGSFLSLCGKWSFELYLSHLMVRSLLNQSNLAARISEKNLDFIKYMTVVLLAFLISFCAVRLESVINRCLFQKENRK